MKKNFLKSSCSRGFSLLDVMVGIGMFGILTSGFVSHHRSAIRNQSYIQAKGEIHDIRQYIRNLYSANQTFAGLPGGCTETTNYIDIKTCDGSIIIDSSGTFRIGKYQIRAKCLMVGEYDLAIDVLRVNSSGGTMESALTGKTEVWQNLFAGIPLASKPSGGGSGASAVVDAKHFLMRRFDWTTVPTGGLCDEGPSVGIEHKPTSIPLTPDMAGKSIHITGVVRAPGWNEMGPGQNSWGADGVPSGHSWPIELCYYPLLPGVTVEPNMVFGVLSGMFTNGTPTAGPGLLNIFTIGSSRDVIVPAGATELAFGFNDEFYWEDNWGVADVSISGGGSRCQ